MTLPHLFGGPFAGFVEWLIRASLSGTAIAAIIVLIQLLLGRWLTPAWRYRLWAVMVIRLLLPVLPASPASLSNFELSTHIRQAVSHFRSAGTNTRRPSEPVNSVGVTAEPMPTTITVVYGPVPHVLAPLPQLQAKATVVNTNEPFQNLPAVLFLAWLGGVFMFSARLIVANVLLGRRLRDAATTKDAILLERFDDCCRRAGIRRQPALLITSAIRIPATAGLWRPRILLPPRLFDRLSDHEQRSVLLHELAHVRCRDVASNWVLAFAQILHWFNPAIVLAIGRMKVDREMARDAMVLRWMSGDDALGCREQYARTLLNLAASLSTGPRCLAMAAGLAGICRPPASVSQLFGRRSGLKRRIKMINRYPGGARRRCSMIGPVLVVLIAATTLTGAKDPTAALPPSTTPATSPATQPAEPEAAIHDLVAQAKSLTLNAKFPEAITVLDQILARDPHNDYARQLRPLLQERVQFGRVRTKDERAAQGLQDKLDRNLPELTFDAVGLGDVVDFLRDVSGANIFVNWKSLEGPGIDRNTPVTAKLRNVRFSKVLGIILDSAGGGKQKLGYTTDEGVITISTVDDLSRNVVVRVYDVRDLLVIPPDYVAPQLTGGLPGPTTAPTTSPALPGAPPREELAKSIVKSIEDTVAPDTWKDHDGTVGALRELQGQLIITQTPENHLRIVELLEQLRAARDLQCLVDAQFISCDEPVARALLAKWRRIAAPATLPAASATQPSGSGTVGLFLDDAQVGEFLHAGQDASKLSVIASPKILLFSGQRANVLLATSRRYTSGYAAVTAAGGQTRYDPIPAVVETGVLLDLQATLSADRKAITLSLHPQVSTLLGMKQLPWIGRPAGSNLMVQEPQVRSAELQTTVTVPDGRTLLLGGMEDPRVPDDPAAATRPDRPLRSLFLLVKPTLIVQGEGEQKQFPLLMHPKDR